MSASADTLKGVPERLAEPAVPIPVDEIPYPSGDKLKGELDTIIRQFDSKGYIKLIAGYYFFVSQRFRLIQEIDCADSPFDGQRFDKVLLEAVKNLDTLSESMKDEVVKVAAREFKIHLMPKSQYMLPTIRLIFDFLKSNPMLVSLIHSLKIASIPGGRDRNQMEMPSIVIYPILGRDNAKFVFDAFRKFFSKYNVKQLGENRKPRYNAEADELVYYSNGGGDFKNKLTAEDRSRYLTNTMVHFAPAFTSQDPYLLTPPDVAATTVAAPHAAAFAAGEETVAAASQDSANAFAAASASDPAPASAPTSAAATSDKTKGEDTMLEENSKHEHVPKGLEKNEKAVPGLESQPTQKLEWGIEDIHSAKGAPCAEGAPLALGHGEGAGGAIARKPSSFDEGSQPPIQFAPPPPPPSSPSPSPAPPPTPASFAPKPVCFSATARAVVDGGTEQVGGPGSEKAAAPDSRSRVSRKRKAKKILTVQISSAGKEKDEGRKTRKDSAIGSAAAGGGGAGPASAIAFTTASAAAVAMGAGAGSIAATAGGDAGTSSVAQTDPLDWGERKTKKRRRRL